MPSYHIKDVIKGTVQKVAAASVPSAFLPGVDLAVVGGFWTYMISEIAEEHNVSFADDTAKFIGVIASGVSAYWVGGKILTKVVKGAILVLAPYAYFVINPLMNVILNAYFTWAIGKRADTIFADNSGTSAGIAIAQLIVKSVCHIPDVNELRQFLSEGGLSLSDLIDDLT